MSRRRCTRYVALHPLRGAAPEQKGCNAYGSGALPLRTSHSVVGVCRGDCAAQRGGLPRTLSTVPCSCRWLSTGVDCLDDLNLWGCENPHMSSHQLTVIRSSEACRMAHEEKESGAFLHVMRGCYVRVEDAHLLDTPWRTWITVARARLLAVHALGSGDRVFVGASSLASRGIPLWEANPDVYVWAPTRRGSKPLRAVRAAGVLVPGVSVRWSVVSPLERELQTVGGVLAEGVIDAAVRMACWSEPLSAFVGICMVLNRQSSFDLFSQEERRDRAQGVRSEMLVRLMEWRQHNDNIPARRAEALIRTADPGCDNPAEAALLWVVKSVCAFEVVTQYEIVVNGRRYFADIAIPGLMIIFEFDGIGKLDKNDADFAQAKREWIQRENDLRSAGWTIYRVSWPDYEDLVRLRAWVTELLAPYQASIPASAQRLWAVPTQACDGPNRRFHMGASRRRSQGSYT